MSVWTPWKDIYTRLPKRIYAKILATSDMEVKYKPKVCSFSSPILWLVGVAYPYLDLYRSSSLKSGTRS